MFQRVGSGQAARCAGILGVLISLLGARSVQQVLNSLKKDIRFGKSMLLSGFAR
jgi:hypothetical protein